MKNEHLRVAPEYPPKNVGEGRVVYRNQARKLKKYGYNITIIAGNFVKRKLRARNE